MARNRKQWPNGTSGIVRNWERLTSMCRRLGVFAAVLAIASFATLAPAEASGQLKNQPQPEMNSFGINSAGDGPGSGTVLPDGNLLVASISSHGGQIDVCFMHPGDRSCADKATLKPYHSGTAKDSFYGTAEVLSTGTSDVSIVAYDCCYIPPNNGGAVIFNSTNDGKSFGPEKAAGNIDGVSAATFANGNLVVADSDAEQFRIQSFSPKPSTPVTTWAVPNKRPAGTSSLTTYQGGVLVASDDTSGNTLVEFAKSGSNYNRSTSYKSVTTIKGEDLTGLSGNALMTDPGGSLTGGERVRFLNGNSFSAWHKVPEPTNGDDGYFYLEKVGPAVHIFFVNRRNNYDVYSESTTDGIHWSGLSVYNPSVGVTQLVPVLGSIGSGICYETSGMPVRAQPIMLPQSVHLKAPAKVVTGAMLKLHGTVYPRLKVDVTLQKLSGKRWVSTVESSETSAGTFTFTVLGYKHSYRAVVRDDPGYYQFGYSNSVTLKIAPKQ